jgi:hypothetical protein
MSPTRKSRPLMLSAAVVAALAGAASLVGDSHAAGAASAAPVVAGPPWISIEYPVNPFDRTTLGAHLLVHAYYHGTPVGYPVSGTAEGLLNGERRTVTLRFETTSRAGVYALRKQWPSEGSWTLVINVTQSEHDRGGVAQALVELSPTGAVASVHVPTRQQAELTIPRRLTAQEIDATVRAQAQRVGLAARSGG